MRTVSTVLLALALSTPAGAQLATTHAGELRAIIEAQDAAQPQTGLVVAVNFPDGSVWEGSSGWSDPRIPEPIRTDHVFVFASITKTFTAAVIMGLMEEGVLDLEDRIGQFIGPYTNINAGIQLHHLLGHTSGVYNFTNHPNLAPRVRSDLNRRWSPNAILTDFVSPPIFFAGDSGAYSNTNYVILEAVAEAATGETMGALMHRLALDPAGLNHTFFAPEEDVIGPLPTIWWEDTGDGIPDDFTAVYNSTSFRTSRGSGGGMYSTTGDIAAWARALFSGSVVAPSSVEQMLTFHRLSGMNATWTGYGLGIQQYQVSEVELWGHSGLVAGSTSLMIYSPELDVSIAMVDNDARSNHFNTARALVDYLKAADLTATAVEAVPEGLMATLYPNPVPWPGRATFQSDRTGELSVFDLLGRKVLSASVNPGPNALQLGSLNRGLYAFRFAGRTGTFLVR